MVVEPKPFRENAVLGSPLRHLEENRERDAPNLLASEFLIPTLEHP